MALRHWCITVFDIENFYVDLDQDQWKDIRYLVYQIEKCPDTGKEHIQGYVEFKKLIRMAGVKKLFNDKTMHLEKRRGTRDEARAYCMKEESRVKGPFELGEWLKSNKDGETASGNRTDLKRLYCATKEKTDIEILEDEGLVSSYMRNFRAVDRVRSLRKPKRTVDLKVHLYYGEPGTGKSFKAYKNEIIWAKPVGQGFWFDGYMQERTVLIDDFSGASSHITLTDLLRILDCYPILVPVKGSHVWWCPDLIIVTSNVHPQNWYKYEERQSSFEALKRRFHKVFHCKKATQDMSIEVMDVVDGVHTQEDNRYTSDEIEVNKFFDLGQPSKEVFRVTGESEDVLNENYNGW
ncbi:Rep [uncultured virus]|uniref:ATP-dependent helicase Rep n=1 Tax=uncultured virus TaxID=340016 RepID=A0A2K9LSP5_9VIRU|nr:Rep [uncultured virus]